MTRSFVNYITELMRISTIKGVVNCQTSTIKLSANVGTSFQEICSKTNGQNFILDGRTYAFRSKNKEKSMRARFLIYVVVGILVGTTSLHAGNGGHGGQGGHGGFSGGNGGHGGN